MIFGESGALEFFQCCRQRRFQFLERFRDPVLPFLAGWQIALALGQTNSDPLRESRNCDRISHNAFGFQTFAENGHELSDFTHFRFSRPAWRGRSGRDSGIKCHAAFAGGFSGFGHFRPGKGSAD